MSGQIKDRVAGHLDIVGRINSVVHAQLQNA